MKKLGILILIVAIIALVLTTGCVNITGAIKAASGDNAKWKIRVVGWGVSAEYEREMPMAFQHTNAVPQPGQNSVLITPTSGLQVERTP